MEQEKKLVEEEKEKCMNERVTKENAAGKITASKKEEIVLVEHFKIMNANLQKTKDAYANEMYMFPFDIWLVTGEK